jgi:hypothetical protein
MILDDTCHTENNIKKKENKGSHSFFFYIRTSFLFIVLSSNLFLVKSL